MHFLATSYECAALALQMPFSLLVVLISLACAFKKELRSASLIFAGLTIFFAFCGVALELKNYGFYCFTHTEILGTVCVLLSPFVLAIGIIFNGTTKSKDDGNDDLV